MNPEATPTVRLWQRHHEGRRHLAIAAMAGASLPKGPMRTIDPAPGRARERNLSVGGGPEPLDTDALVSDTSDENHVGDSIAAA